MNGQQRIDTITAYIALDHDGTEGVVSWQAPDGTHMPLVAADEARADALLPIAQAISRATGTRVSKVRFSTRDVLVEDVR